MTRQWVPVSPSAGLPEVRERVNDIIYALKGSSGRGRQIVLTDWNETSYALDVRSKEASIGRTLRAISQNGTYGLDLSNTGLYISGAPTLNAFTQGSILFAGAGGLLSQDNPNAFYDAVNHRLGLLNAAPTTPLDIAHKFNVSADGSLNIGPNKFTIAGPSGDLAINVNKFVIDGASGATIGANTIATVLGSLTGGNVANWTGTATWNNAATSFIANLLDITDTASAAGSVLALWRVGVVPKFQVDKAGIITASGNPVFKTVNNWYAPLIGVGTNLTLTAAYQDIPSATVTLSAVGKWKVDAVADAALLGDAGILVSVQLVCAAGATADNAAIARLNGDASDGTALIATIAQSWIVTVSSGTPVIKLQAKKSGGAGATLIVGTNTKLIATWEGNP